MQMLEVCYKRTGNELLWDVVKHVQAQISI